ncbi:DUF2306 domain-containing protein [Aquimarina agarilytica]|uniref:DUF2306 domain-containing protein n=1 Tax=Aquimarina agarilytica TaxID=1087449 RepID=UPI0002882B03|nr:DUF2306 domain-containing protein [Aquimarina agarilytica]
MILITLQYIPIKLNVAFLNIKQEEIETKYYQIAFFSHVYTSIFVLILGITQFSNTIRSTFSSIHKIFGKLYVFLILLIAAPSGLIMALHANGGVFSKISFSIQALLWFWFTYKAFRYAKNKQWDNHQKFMLRGFALTLSAISLRLFKWIIVSTIELPPMDTYKIVSWLGWVFNLTLVEIYLMNKKNYTQSSRRLSS